MKQNKKYKSKILLFGEYTVLHGSKALAMPFSKFAGEWIYDKSHKSRQEIQRLKQYLLTIYRSGKIDNFDFDELERLTSKGLAFESNIPQGYGVGSSGSVTAAVYDLLFKHNERVSINELKSTLGLIESCYHGSSSGVDPLVSYLSQPILIHNKQTVELLDSVNLEINKSLFLIDTSIQRSTAPLVEAYLATRRESEKFLMEMQDIAAINDELIDSYLLDDRELFTLKMKELSRAQYKTMSMMIPDKFKEMWKSGIESGQYSMKLNGAGGGGFLMLMKHDSDCMLEQELIAIV
ncbi:MAG: mevalonate kinase [Saprospiraceae bacterium]